MKKLSRLFRWLTGLLYKKEEVHFRSELGHSIEGEEKRAAAQRYIKIGRHSIGL